jgi:hypothetical protein
LHPAIEDAVRTFDGDIAPRMHRRLGRPLDVDRDGRFTLLFTPWLGRLSDGAVTVSGFVRGSDFYREGEPPYSNRCDMMYLNSDLASGPHLRTVLAHEYAHAVTFCEHTAARYLPELPSREEESWLDEALAHVVEDEHGHGWSNLDYRVSAFLSAPERSPLIVPDYFGTGLWRDPGCRGATYLFLRCCADRHGHGLVPRLVRSSLSGVTNLETATQERFPELFRRWSAALLLSGSGIDAGVSPLTRFDPRRPLGGRFLAGPFLHELPLNGRRELELASTSTAYLLLHSPAGPKTRLTVEADEGAALQVSLVRLPPGNARLSLRRDGDRLGLTAHDAAVTLDGAAWERLHPEANRPDDTSFRPGERLPAWFGDPHLEAGATRHSVPLPMKAGVVWKVTGTDAAGRRVSAWLLGP